MLRVTISTGELVTEADALVARCWLDLFAQRRAIALRELGHFDAAIESLRRARSSKKRHEDVLNKALYERALTYEKTGKKSQAKKDLEKILATDSDFPGVNELLASLEK